MKITKQSVISGKTRTLDIPVNPEDYISWISGYSNIDEAMPYLTTEHKEFILSGITKGEWSNLFVPEEVN